MSPYLMQGPIIGAVGAAVAFAVILLFCSVTDALKGDRQS